MKLKTYQQGGGLIYTPFIPEQEAVSSSGSSARSSGSDEDKIDPLDKEILNLMKGQDLLSSDINLIYDRLISFQRKTQSLSSLGGSTSYRSVMPGMLQIMKLVENAKANKAEKMDSKTSYTAFKVVNIIFVVIGFTFIAFLILYIILIPIHCRCLNETQKTKRNEKTVTVANGSNINDQINKTIENSGLDMNKNKWEIINLYS